MILQDAIPYDVTARRPLPGVAPLGAEDWLLVDEAYAGQMALRERLLDARRSEVIAALPGTAPALAELLDMALAALPPGFSAAGGTVTRPDGATVEVDRDDPLGTLGRLVQEDFCLMEQDVGATEHRLTAAVLCFPSRWSLAEKLGRPLTALHAPVADYDADAARRAQRLFDGLRPGRPLWRWNLSGAETADLFAPMTEAEAHGTPRGAARFLRSERQVLVRLPETKGVVFSIHTYVVRAPG